MDPRSLESLLRRWGRWKQNCILSVGSTGTIEQKISEQLPFGDGCTGGGPPMEGMDGLRLLKASEEVEQVNAAYMQMLDTHRAEMTLINYQFVFEWSTRHIAGHLRMSKATIKNRLTRAKTLIESKLAQMNSS